MKRIESKDFVKDIEVLGGVEIDRIYFEQLYNRQILNKKRWYYSLNINFINQKIDSLIDSKKTKEVIESCIWKTDEFGNANKDLLKIDSEVATDNDKGEFLSILNTGVAPSTMKSKYAENYRYFQKKIDEFLHGYPSYFSYLPARILNNCILLLL